ncbi:o-acyltransferase [Holotrichia oblita]|uniref:O-acyltransferase n=1 Tax=Holotrichia oblita TaxID=644536 RepID=A0ACB9SXP5_HOLOL|nr:o-acyltransferase [Holotrichia oblita]
MEEPKSKPVPKIRKEKLSNILLCFCFTTNAQKILSVDRLPDEAIKCIHGLRFFSIAWIVMVHTYLEVFAVGDNKTMRTVTERSFLYQTVSNATFSVDTFFFIRNNYFKWAAASVIIFLVTSWITTFVIAMQYNYVARVEEPFALFDQLYDKPWMRIGPYLVGMTTGYILFRFDGKIKLPSYVVVSGWILAVGLVLSLVYGLGKGELITPLSAIYATFGHTAWGLALAWITVSCCWGYGGPVNSLLGFRGFLPLSRLTYCAYLIHPVIMVFVSFQLDGPIHIHNYIVVRCLQ